MKKLLERIAAMTPRQRLIAGGGVLASLIVLVLMLHLATAQRLALLYSGLDESAAGEVVAALDAENVPYEVRGRSLFVPEDQRDRLRLTLAQQNLPSPGAQGYELLDELDGFSTTSEMFSVTYWRAKEGELARTLMSMPGIKAARVHIGAEDRGAFSRRNRQRTASVTITAPGGVDDAQVKAIRYLTALAVPDLAASEVAVIDTAMGLLTGDGALPSLGEDRRAEALERDLLRLLEARVGQGNARVNVAIDVARRREEIQERAVDPNSAVVTESIREESQSLEQGTDLAVTIASDLPDGEDQGNERSAESNESREEISYAVSTTDRMIEVLPGGIERLSVAVLVNAAVDEEGNSIPRPQAELDALEALVTAAAGINADRGDRIIVQSLAFDPPAVLPEEPAISWTEQIINTDVIRTAIIGLITLLFGLFVLRPMFSPKAAPEADALLLGDRENILGADGTFDMGQAMLADSFDAAEPSDPLLLLRDRSAEKPEAAATLLNAWLDESETTA
ncbi:MAG: flagellar basal-body MS-ring/collar protein FliF [Pseudomonadota bacterium]